MMKWGRPLKLNASHNHRILRQRDFRAFVWHGERSRYDGIVFRYSES